MGEYGRPAAECLVEDQSRDPTAPPERSIRITTEYQLERARSSICFDRRSSVTCFAAFRRSGPYTDDSDLCTAAIHSGHLKPGEFKVIAIRRRSGFSNYTGSEAHVFVTHDGQQFCGGYEIYACDGTETVREKMRSFHDSTSFTTCPAMSVRR